MKQSLALGRTKLAIERLASKYPLHAGILAQWSHRRGKYCQPLRKTIVRQDTGTEHPFQDHLIERIILCFFV